MVEIFGCVAFVCGCLDHISHAYNFTVMVIVLTYKHNGSEHSIPISDMTFSLMHTVLEITIKYVLDNCPNFLGRKGSEWRNYFVFVYKIICSIVVHPTLLNLNEWEVSFCCLKYSNVCEGRPIICARLFFFKHITFTINEWL